jgi:hypothetical protein
MSLSTENAHELQHVANEVMARRNALSKTQTDFFSNKKCSQLNNNKKNIGIVK